MQLPKTSKGLSLFTSISKYVNLPEIVVLIITKHRLIAYTLKCVSTGKNTVAINHDHFHSLLIFILIRKVKTLY